MKQEREATDHRIIMRMLILSAGLILTGTTFLFADSSASAQASKKYMNAAAELQARMSAYEGPGGEAKFREDQNRNIAASKAKMEAARASGMMSDSDYAEARKSMAAAEDFMAHGGSGADTAKMQQAGNQLNERMNECKKLNENTAEYQSCVQKAIAGFHP